MIPEGLNRYTQPTSSDIDANGKEMLIIVVVGRGDPPDSVHCIYILLHDICPLCVV